MSTAVATINGFNQDQVDLIRKQVAPPGTTNDELALFLAYASRTGLDPFSRQIYLSERRSRGRNDDWVTTRKPEVTIDGLRLVAERTGQYAGQIGPEWCDESGQWRDVWLSSKAPAAARVGVLRRDFQQPLYAVALWSEYAQIKDSKPVAMWGKYPSVMLAKCAESLALRRAFPRELSGLYTKEEMPDEQPTFSREAQQEVAQQRIAQLSAPKPIEVPPSVVVELAESLDKPVDSGFKSAAEVADDSMPDWAKKKEPKPKPAVSFEMLQAYSEVKKQLAEAYGSDAKYYEILGGFGYESSKQIPDRPTGTKIYKTLTNVLTAWKRDKADRDEANELILKIDYPLLESEVAAMTSEEVGRLLVVLREKAKAKETK